MRPLLTPILYLACGLGAIADQVYFRDGTSEAGTVISEHNGVYTFQGRQRGTYPLAKEKVRFVVYEDAATAVERLRLEDLLSRCADPVPAAVDILPAEAYAEAVLEAVRGARKYIYVMTYNLSGGQSGTLADLYQALQERAAAGVKVYIIVPGGSRAAAGVKIASQNYAEKLAASGIQVRFLRQAKVQHKKLIIVDTRKAFLGSSNLTAAALSDNVELNIATEQPAFVREAVADFRSMLRRAKAPD
jgi:phosphatidylserine/phosphatidylglycerophosphate/cardiolipin synthase-like enzyme